MKLRQMLLGLFARFDPNKLRVVLDTNVLVNGTIVRYGAPARILTAVTQRQIRLILSPYLLAEYLSVLQRPHISRRYPHFREQLALVRRFAFVNAIWTNPTTIEQVIADDPKDDAILACAHEGKAAYIVSGDEHLLALREYRGIKILTPRDFVVTVLGETIPASH
jgi:putative PIN family toxin of toxin-antitoxin system